MPLSYVLDEHLRGPLWSALLQHNSAGVDVVDVIRVGDLPELPLGISDPDLLLWSEQANRVLVTLDRNTVPGHLADHLVAGHRSPGILMIRRHRTLPSIVFSLVLLAWAGDPLLLQDRILYVP